MNAVNTDNNEKRTDYPLLKAYVITHESTTEAGEIKFLAKGYKSRAKHHTFYYAFRSAVERERYINSFLKNLESHEELLHKRKLEREKPSELNKGDCFNFSWGYEQTNQNFFQVVEVLKNNYVVIREIGKTYRETGFMFGYAKPEKDHFIGEPIRKKVIFGDAVKIKSYGWCNKTEWDKEHIQTSYA